VARIHGSAIHLCLSIINGGWGEHRVAHLNICTPTSALGRGAATMSCAARSS
jgi:hypothetical protein